MAHPDIVTGDGGGRDSGGSRISLDIDPDAGNQDIQGNGHDGLELEDSEDQGAFEDPQSNLDLEDEEGDQEEGDEPEQPEDQEAETDQFEGLDDEEGGGLEAGGDFSIELGNGKSFDLNKVKDLPKEVKAAIRDGFMRNKDYTEKCQTLSRHQEQWHETVTGASQIWENFNATKIRPDMLTQWFSPQELLMAVAATGLEVDPSLLPVGWKPGMPNYDAMQKGFGQAGMSQGQQPQGPQGQAQPQQNQNYEQEKLNFQTQITFALNDGLSGIKDKSIKKTVREMALGIMMHQTTFNPQAAIKEAKMRMRGMLSGLRGQKKAMQKRGRIGKGAGGGSGLVTGSGNRKPTSWDAADESADGRIRGMR